MMFTATMSISEQEVSPVTSSSNEKNTKNERVTLSHVFGEVVWLFSQSQAHAAVSVNDLNWLVMPPITHRLFHIFREGDRPIGVAMWATLNEDGELKVAQGLRLTGEKLTDDEWTAGDRLWLVDLVAPFATIDNRHAELMLADLVTGPFKRKQFKMLGGATEFGKPQILEFQADIGDRLVAGARGILRTDFQCH